MTLVHIEFHGKVIKLILKKKKIYMKYLGKIEIEVPLRVLRRVLLIFLKFWQLIT